MTQHAIISRETCRALISRHLLASANKKFVKNHPFSSLLVAVESLYSLLSVSLKFFPGCIEAREVPFACSEPRNVPNQSFTSDLRETSPPSTAGQESSPPVSLSQISSKLALKSPKSPIRAHLAASSSQENKYSGWTNSKRSWSYHPYQPRDNPQLSRSPGRPVSSPDKGPLTVSQPSGADASQQEPGSSSTWPEETPVLVIFTSERTASDVPLTRLCKDEDLSVHALRSYIQSNIQRVDCCLHAPPRGRDGSKQEAAPSDRAVQPSNSNPDLSAPQTSERRNRRGNALDESLRSTRMINPFGAVSGSVARFHASSPTTSSDPGAYEANPSPAARNLASVPSRSTRDNTQLQEVTLNVTPSEISPQFKLEKDNTDISTLANGVQVNGLQTEPAQNSGPRVRVKEQPEAVEISALANTHCGSLKNEVCVASCLFLRCV